MIGFVSYRCMFGFTENLTDVRVILFSSLVVLVGWLSFSENVCIVRVISNSC